MSTFSVQSIDTSTLTPIVRQSVRHDNLNIQDWHVNQLGGGAGNQVTFGLYRFAGTGLAEDKLLPWSVILKIIQSPANVGAVNLGEGDNQAHWNYWKRESLIYQSGLLETLPEGLTTPRCFSIIEKPGNIFLLWLEDVAGSHAESWSLDRYALTARHLGQLNGIYCSERALPSVPWLGKHRIQQWLEGAPMANIPMGAPSSASTLPKVRNEFISTHACRK